MNARRTEPSAALIPSAGQPKLAYVNAASTDIRARFEAERARLVKPVAESSWMPSAWAGLANVKRLSRA